MTKVLIIDVIYPSADHPPSINGIDLESFFEVIELEAERWSEASNLGALSYLLPLALIAGTQLRDHMLLAKEKNNRHDADGLQLLLKLFTTIFCDALDGGPTDAEHIPPANELN